jgi:hypothetical protein
MDFPYRRPPRLPFYGSRGATEETQEGARAKSLCELRAGVPVGLLQPWLQAPYVMGQPLSLGSSDKAVGGKCSSQTFSHETT